MSQSRSWWFRRPALNWLELIGLGLAVALVAGGLGATAAINLSPRRAPATRPGSRRPPCRRW
ncbi:MAG: hypothetical protein QM779_05030 [Propionicimonas sp.]|uniref:hypothetical protein n=1 Tax=Propionicimonas sp. TaxID=1955623 RepID=UPI003D14D444